VKSISDLDIAGKTVLLRSDFNVPLAKDGSGVITDDGRIVASLPTIKALSDAGAKVVVLAHLGRPKGVGFEASGSLAPVAARLGELLGQDVALAGDVSGDSAKAVAAGLQPGQVALLENVRFDSRETSKDEAQRKELAAEWASLGDVYVSDGFGVVHRKQASVTDLAELLPNAAGLLVEKEVKSFSKVLADPDRPYVVILGGSKVSDKLGVIDNLIDSVDRLLIGGGMAYTFLAANGYEVGTSLLESDQVDAVKGYIAKAAEKGIELVIPVDTMVADAFPGKDNPTPERKVVPSSEIPAGWMGLDIGPQTIELFMSHRNAGGCQGNRRLRGVLRHRRRRFRRCCSPTRSRGWLLPHLHRRWRLPRAPRGQDASRSRSPGGLKHGTQAIHGRKLEDEPRPPRGHRPRPEDRIWAQR